MLTANESRRRANNLLSMAVRARDGGDEETADQLVLSASELFKQAAQQERISGADRPRDKESPACAAGLGLGENRELILTRAAPDI